MIYHIENSDITKVASGIIVHGCNAQGVMGSGVAKQLRAKYPDIFTDYTNILRIFKDIGDAPLGCVIWTDISPQLVIANAITQEFYGRDGGKYVSYDAIDEAFKQVADSAKSLNMEINVPYLIGAGLGGGNAGIIEEIISANTQNLVVNFHHWK